MREEYTRTGILGNRGQGRRRGQFTDSALVISSTSCVGQNSVAHS